MNTDPAWYRDMGKPSCPSCGSHDLESLAGKKVTRALVFAPALLGVVGKHWECQRCHVRF